MQGGDIMNITLYNCTDDERKLNKTLTAVKTTDAVLLNDGFSYLAPSLLLRGSPADFVGVNYAYIPDLGRYYYIRDITIEHADRVRLYLSVDVLMSWRTQILDLDVIALRSTNHGNQYIIDNKIQLQRKPFIITKRLTYSMFDSELLDNNSCCYVVNIMSSQGVE